LITSDHKEIDDFSNGDFDDELMKWVVKYPTTPEPWEIGNTLIFGHTSSEAWKKNPYATVFKDIPTLQNGEVIKVIREWQLYKYQIIDHRIVLPKDVNTNYLEFQDKKKDYITLMWCYPIGKAAKRYLVIAEAID
jgi:LPXTG-site transpeptidase (sortase) family protein